LGHEIEVIVVSSLNTCRACNNKANLKEIIEEHSND
jgi:hypothetical protein